MDILKTNQDESVEVKLSRAEINAIAACLWEARGMGFNNLYHRFFPQDAEEISGMDEDTFFETCYDIKRQWGKLDVDMG